MEEQPLLISERRKELMILLFIFVWGATLAIAVFLIYLVSGHVVEGAGITETSITLAFCIIISFLILGLVRKVSIYKDRIVLENKLWRKPKTIHRHEFLYWKERDVPEKYKNGRRRYYKRLKINYGKKNYIFSESDYENYYELKAELTRGLPNNSALHEKNLK